MATILNDTELKKLIGTVIINGITENIRPNSYILRLGKYGSYLNTDKNYSIGDKDARKGIKIPPGHSIGFTSYEDIDFSRETIRKIYPNSDLHAIITPTTNLSREGIVAPSTQIDSGYNGTLNWTFVNTSNKERRYLYQTGVFRMLIFKLDKNELPLKPYEGHYQKQFGYVKSKRFEAPVGMDEAEWETAFNEGGPEGLLEILAKAGPPWNVLSERLRIIDNKFSTVTDEYNNIRIAIDGLKEDLKKVCSEQESIISRIDSIVREILKNEASSLQNRWLLGVGSLLLALSGITITITTNSTALSFLKDQGIWIGIVILLIGFISLLFVTRKKKT